MDRPAPRRSPTGGGYARGGEKRLRIIEAALQRFGREGYGRASTRQIAQDAGVNPPALQYYFDGKEGLHRACAEYLVERFEDAMRVVYERSEQVNQDDPVALLEALCDIMDALAHYLFETNESDNWSRFMARGQGEDGNEPAYRLLLKVLKEKLHGHCCRLVGLLIGQAPTDTFTRLQTMSILGQLTVFHLGRCGALDRLGWPDLRGPRLQMLKDMVRAQTRAILMPCLDRGLSHSPCLGS